MRSLLSLVILTVSSTVWAAEYQAVLDLRKLYGGVNAGQYNASLTLHEKTSPSEVQSHSNHYDNDSVPACTQMRSFTLGKQILNLSSQEARSTLNSENEIIAAQTAYASGEDCQKNVLPLNPWLDVRLATAKAVLSHVTPPRGYDEVIVYLQPTFVQSLKIPLQTEEEISGAYIDRPQNYFQALYRQPAAVLKYYVIARKGNLELSLGAGEVTF